MPSPCTPCPVPFPAGISVDTGSDIAKEAADVILLERSLLVLQQGVAQGRVTHGEWLGCVCCRCCGRCCHSELQSR